MIRFLFILIIFLYGNYAFAQDPAHYIIGKDIFDGVHLYSIIQDDTDNSMWITSNKGIYQYDGINFTHQIPQKAKSTDFFGLTKDSQGNIFCNNLNGQIFKLNHKTFELYYTIVDVSYRNISCIVFDNQDNLIVSSQDNSIIIPSNKKNIVFSKNQGYGLTKYEDTVYYFSFSKDNHYLLKKRFDNKETVKGTYSTLWYPLCITKNHLYSFPACEKIFELKNNTAKNIPRDFLGKGAFRVFLIGRNFWFFKNKKGVVVVPEDQLSNQVKLNEWFKAYFLSGGMVDKEGNTWLLTFNKGIIIIPNLQNKVLPSPNTSELKFISKTGKKLYVSTFNGQLYQINQHSFIPFFKERFDRRLDYLKVFPEKNTIVTSSFLYTNNTYQIVSYCRTAVLNKDNLLLGLSNGLYSHNLRNGKEKKIASGRTYSIYYDTLTQKKWFATTNGLRQYKNGYIKSIKYNNQEILEAKIQAVTHQVWVSSNSGVYIFEKDSLVHHLTEKDGLLSNGVDNIKYEYPYVYLLYQKGMQRYNLHTKKFSAFTQSNGLTKKITSFEVLNDTVYAVNSDGLLTFTFDNNSDSIPVYQTKITKATANGTNSFLDYATLKSEEKNIEFSFLTPTFRYQKELSYQYQLIGYDKKPVLAKPNQHFINYANLPSGEYTFRVDSFFGKYQNQPAILHFTISEFWYNTSWFRLLALCVLMTMLYFVYKSRINAIIRKRDKEEMQKRLAESSLTSLKAQMNPHFLFNAMNSIQSLIIDNQKDEAYEYLTQLSNLLRENLQMSDVSFVPFLSEFKLIKKYLELEKLRFEESLTYTIENNVYNEEVLIPSMIIQPFIENAIKHGLLHKIDNRLLKVQFVQQDDLIICTVTDNGIGRKASAILQEKRKYKSFSTQAIQKRFEILKEYYKINIGFSYKDLYENDEPTGTQVTIKIPYTDEFEE